jgi:hypothetical protein
LEQHATDQRQARPRAALSACWKRNAHSARGYFAYAVDVSLVLDELDVGLNKQDERFARNGSGPGLDGVLSRYDDRAESWANSPLQMPIADHVPFAPLECDQQWCVSDTH